MTFVLARYLDAAIGVRLADEGARVAGVGLDAMTYGGGAAADRAPPGSPGTGAGEYR